MENRQFRVLYRVFLLRVVDLELLSSDADPVRLLGQIAALFAAVSFLFCTPLILASGRLDEVAKSTMEHALIAMTMVVVGLLSVLNWDAIFPDKRDAMVLGPLPVVPRTIFMAKLAAIAYTLGVATLALNIFSGLLWPLYFSSSDSFLGLIRSFAAYWTTVAIAAGFMFFLVLTAQGVASQLIPRQLFLRLSAWIQMAAFCLFLGMYILEPSLEVPQLLLAPDKQRLLACLPSYWLLGLFHQLNGDPGPAHAVFSTLAGRAYMAIVAVVVGAGATLLLSYMRSLRKIAETPEILPYRRQSIRPSRFRFRARAKSVAITIMLFSLRTLMRSRQHRLLLSFYFGVGLAIVLGFIQTLLLVEPPQRGTAVILVNGPVIAASILILCVAVAGVRIVTSLPISLHANWLFRVTELHPPSAYATAVRLTYCLLGIAPVWLGSSGLFFTIWPWRLAAQHLLLLALLGLILVEVCLWSFAKIPFTCSYLPGKGNLQYVFWAFTLILLPLISAAARIELRTLNNGLSYGALLAGLALALGWSRWFTTSRALRLPQMRFEEADAPAILTLDLRRLK
jgi:hypothetical protein